MLVSIRFTQEELKQLESYLIHIKATESLLAHSEKRTPPSQLILEKINYIQELYKRERILVDDARKNLKEFKNNFKNNDANYSKL